MNALEFVEEVKKSELCPDNFEEIYRDFQRYQRLAWDTLLELHKICERNAIRYQLAFGSLLGAIRDGGQIPWDYDIDVFVVAEDRAKLVAALTEGLNSKYYFDCAENNPSCRNEILRVCPKGYRTEALHVDVFFLVGAPENERDYHDFVKRIAFLSNTRFEKLVNIKEEFANRPKARILHTIRKLKFLLYNTEKMHREYLELCSGYSIYRTEKGVEADSFAEKISVPSEYVRDTMLMEIQGAQLRVPVHYESVLGVLYKEYYKVPALEDRIREMMYNYKRLKRFEDYKK